MITSIPGRAWMILICLLVLLISSFDSGSAKAKKVGGPISIKLKAKAKHMPSRIQWQLPHSGLLPGSDDINEHVLNFTHLQKSFADALYLKRLHPADHNGSEEVKISLPSNDCLQAFFGDVSRSSQYFDALGKPGSGIVKGNSIWLGSYELCYEISNSRYCLASTELFSNPAFTGLLGVCAPNRCKEDEIRSLLQLIFPYIAKSYAQYVSFPEVGALSKTYGKPVVCDKKNTYTTGSIAMLSVCAILASLCVAGTFCEIIKGFSGQSFSNKNKEFMPIYECTDDEEESTERLPYNPDEHPLLFHAPLYSGNTMSRIGKWMVDLLLCFSIIKNTKIVLNTRSAPGAITAVHGIRTISMWWVILGHTYEIGSTTLVDNVVDVRNLLYRFTFLPIANGFVSVDSFFLLSGLLVSYLSLRRFERDGKLPLVQYYVHRFLRLTPSYLFVILMLMYVFIYLGKGPFWSLLPGSTLISSCKKHWWTNILYINNFYPKKQADECSSWTWYLANDMQFHVISPIILYIMYRFKLEGTLVANTFLCLLSFIVTGVLVSYYDLNSIPSGDINIGKNDRYVDIVYVKPYCRIAPYLVGLVLGYLLHYKFRLRGRFTWLMVLFGWCMAIISGLAVVYGVRKEFKRDSKEFTRAENLFYGTFCRFAWGVALAWVIYACHFGYGGLINKMLSWKAFVPLSRLTYGAYLLHPLVLTLYYNSLQAVRHYTDMSTGFEYIAIVATSYASAYILAIWIEHPFFNLEKLIFRFK